MVSESSESAESIQNGFMKIKKVNISIQTKFSKEKCYLCKSCLELPSHREQCADKMGLTDRIYYGQCGHAFHASCINDWTKKLHEKKEKTVLCPVDKVLWRVVNIFNPLYNSHEKETENVENRSGMTFSVPISSDPPDLSVQPAQQIVEPVQPIPPPVPPIPLQFINLISHTATIDPIEIGPPVTLVLNQNGQQSPILTPIEVSDPTDLDYNNGTPLVHSTILSIPILDADDLEGQDIVLNLYEEDN